MSPGIRQSESQFAGSWVGYIDESLSPGSPPIASEDLAKLGVEAQFIPFILSTILQTEQSPIDLPPLSPEGAENLVEILDKVHLPP